MIDETAEEMDVTCAFCGELKVNCTCGLTAGGTFGIRHAYVKEK